MFVDPHIIVQFTKKIQQDATVYQNFISHLYEAQHISGDTPPIIRRPKLHVDWTCSCWTLTASNNPPRMQNQRLLVQF